MKHIYSLKIEQTVNLVNIKDSIQNNFTDKTLGVWLKNSKTNKKTSTKLKATMAIHLRR